MRDFACISALAAAPGAAMFECMTTPAPNSPQVPGPQKQVSQRLLFGVIIGGMLLWGAYLALGAYLYNHNPWRPVVVMGCVLAFLGIWMGLVWNRNRRLRAKS